MPLCAYWVSYPVGKSWGDGYSDSSFQASIGRVVLEDPLRCHSFSRVYFSCVEISEFYSTRFFQFSGTVPFLICSTVENISSKTTW